LGKSYLVNRTALGTPYEKSAMFSYISTPNEKSFNVERRQMREGKIREQFQSTEDDNFGEDSVRVTLIMDNRKSSSRVFAASQKISLIGAEF
jgi:hypothetical protein